MNRLPLFALALGFLAGCGYSEEKYAEDYMAAVCTSMTGCEADIVGAYVDMGLDEATAQSTFDTTVAIYCSYDPDAAEEGDGEDTCDFDGGAAKECVDSIETITCDQWVDGSASDVLMCSMDVCG